MRACLCACVCMDSMHIHTERHTQAAPHTKTHSVVGTELCDLVRSAGSLLSQYGFPWLNFKGKIHRKTAFTLLMDRA